LKNIRFLLFLFLFLASTIAHAQKSALLWGTYFGGDTTILGTGGMATDPFGNALIIGTTYSDTGLATNGAYLTMGSVNGDAILAKFSPLGKLLWATYFGGNSTGIGVATDAFGNVFITGWTSSSSGIATSGAYQTSFGGNEDAFLAKFNSMGHLLWSTYYGGSKVDGTYSLATDSSGNVFITGITYSMSGIATKGAYKTLGDSINGDAFIAKFSPLGNLLWGTYYGGDNFDEAESIATDKSNNIYITGITYSTSGIATTGAYQTLGDSGGAFITKFSPSGNLLWGTYFNGTEYGDDVTTDFYNNVYVTGSTFSSFGVATSGAYQTSGNSVDGDAYLAKFGTSGSLIWATYYGGNNQSGGANLAVDHSGNIYLSGPTNSISGIATSGAYQTSFSGGIYDAFLTKFTDAGNLLWSTYYGEFGLTACESMAIDSLGNAYLYGFTSCTSGIATAGAYQTSDTIGNILFLAKFGIHTYNNDAGVLSIPAPIRNSCTDTIPLNVKLKNYGIDTLKSVKINWEINSVIQTGYNWTGNLVSGGVSPVTVGTYNFSPGSYSITSWTSLPNGVTDSFTANDTAISTETVSALPQAYTGGSKSVCTGDSISIGGPVVGTDLYSWTSKPTGYVSSSATTKVAPNVTSTYYLTETTQGGGCSKSDSVVITVKPLPPTPTITKFQDTLISSSTSDNQWLKDSAIIKGADNQKYVAAEAGNYSVMVTDSNGCTATSLPYIFTGINDEFDKLKIIIYPNPFTNQTTISGALDGNSSVNLTIYDMTGRVIVEKSVECGAGERFEYTFDADRYGCGIYIVKLTMGNEVVTREIARIR